MLIERWARRRQTEKLTGHLHGFGEATAEGVVKTVYDWDLLHDKENGVACGY